jgi:hypothetical protein
MSQEEYEQTMEENHYYQTLADVVELMSLHGNRKVLLDLIEMSMQLDLVSTISGKTSNSIN